MADKLHIIAQNKSVEYPDLQQQTVPARIIASQSSNTSAELFITDQNGKILHINRISQGTYPTITDALADIPLEKRKVGMKFIVDDGQNVTWYWFKSGTADADVDEFGVDYDTQISGKANIRLDNVASDLSSAEKISHLGKIGAEPAIGAKGTAFNKNFGAGANDVAKGNHTHSQLHTHSNKSTLDGITPTKISEWDSKAEGNHTHELSDVSGLANALDSKVDKVAGKELSDNNYSTQEKNKLASLENYDDSSVLSQLGNKLDKGNYVGTAEDLDDAKEDKFTKNTAFNKNFGTTSNTVARGNHSHSQYLTPSDVIENHLGKEFIGTYLTPITTPEIEFTMLEIGNEVIITYQGANMPTIANGANSQIKIYFLDMGVDFVPNELCRIYLHIVDKLTTSDEMYIDITVKPITLLS